MLQRTPSFDPDPQGAPSDAFAAMQEVYATYHQRAAASGLDGVIVLFAVRPSLGEPLNGKAREAKETHTFSVGDVDGMVAATDELSRRGFNVWFAPAVMRRGLPRGSRGTKRDLLGVLGLVIDDDGDTGKRAKRPPGIEPTFEIATSTVPAVNRQPHYVFTRAMRVDEAATLAELLHQKCGGDHGTKDVAHVWRPPDTLNHPTPQKLARNRPVEPQDVTLTGGSGELVDPDALRRALEAMRDLEPPKAKKKKANGNGTGNGHGPYHGAIHPDDLPMPDWLQEKMGREGEDRSAHSCRVMLNLMECGLDDDAIKHFAHTRVFANKFVQRGDLDDEIDRVRSNVWSGEIKFDVIAAYLRKQQGHSSNGSGNGSAQKNGTAAPQQEQKDTKRTQAQILIDIALGDDVELFHAPDGTAFADVLVDGHRETWALKSPGFRRWIKRAFYAETKGAPNSDAMSTAMGVTEAKAHFDGPKHEVYLRVAHVGDAIYLDLCADDWSAVEVTAEGWQIVKKPPVRFRRKRGMQEIPEPTHGGDIKTLGGLKQHLNVDQDSFVLVVAWLLAILRGAGPFPILALTGEQGAGKTMLAKLLQRLVDPRTGGIRSMPKDTRDLYIAAMNGQVLVFDNLSGISAEMSDCLCRLSTGGGFATRQLHTDDEEVIFEGQRPIALTSINDVASRSDLADRAMLISLEPICEDERQLETKLHSAFDAERPAILGALLDVVAHGLLQLPHTHMNRLPRMADFALWVRACEDAIWAAGSFMAAYETNLEDAADVVLDSDQVGVALRNCLKVRGTFTGTTTQLLDALTLEVNDTVKRSKFWPVNAKSLSGRLKRLTPALRKVGITIENWRRPDTSRAKMVTIEQEATEGAQ